MANATTYLIFLQTAPSLENSVQSELSNFGISARIKKGGVEFRGTQSDLWRVCLLSRCAESVRIRLKTFPAKDFEGLQKELRKLPFSAFLERGARVELKVVCHKSRLWHSGAVEERARKVLEGGMGLMVHDPKKSPRGGPEAVSEGAAPRALIHLRLMDDEVQVSLDASGELLHRRGTRKYVERASLRETLAAALFFTAWEHRGEANVLWDPFCGAGTIPLEALCWARGVVPGRERTFAFEHFRGHDSAAFASFREELVKEHRLQAPALELRIIASDSSARAMKTTELNLNSAGVLDGAELLCGDIEEVMHKVPEGAFIVTNPPYGKRLSDARAVSKLRHVLKLRPDLHPCVVLVGEAARRSLGNEAPSLLQTKNGGLSVSVRLLRA